MSRNPDLSTSFANFQWKCKIPETNFAVTILSFLFDSFLCIKPTNMKNDIYMHVKTHQVLCLDFSYRRGSTIVRSKSCSSHVCCCLTGYSFITSSPLVSHIRVSELVSIVTACCLFGAKPYPEPMLVHCKWDSREQISVKFEFEIWNSITFIQENAFENVVYQNGGHFVQGEMGQHSLSGHGYEWIWVKTH